MPRRHDPNDPAKLEGSGVTQFQDLEPGYTRLTFHDRRQATIWASGAAAALCRLHVYADPDEEDEIGDFISIYRPSEQWASWCVARRGHAIIVWETKHGKDLGSLPDMIEALHGIWRLICEPLPSLHAVRLRRMRNR